MSYAQCLPQLAGSNMDETEGKTKNDGSNDEGDAVRSNALRPGRREIESVGRLEPVVALSLRSFRDEAEIHAINIALEQTGWNRKRAAKLLSISYRGLLYKIRRHNITPTVEHG